jgi:hypothetical protein
MSDGGALCFRCLKEERRNILEALQDPSYRTGWEVEGFCINWEDCDLYCDHCSQPIESAYGKGD